MTPQDYWRKLVITDQRFSQGNPDMPPAEFLAGVEFAKLELLRTQKERDELKTILGNRPGEVQRLRRAVEKIGFYFAGTEHQRIADAALWVLAGNDIDSFALSARTSSTTT